MQKYPYIILTCILAAVLVGPFILKLKDIRLEIYPAVIFPSGAGLVENNQDFIVSHSIELFGYKENELVEINKKKFLHKIPIHYLYAIIEGNFGLKEYRNEFKLYKPPIKFVITNNFTKNSIEKTKMWLRESLQEQSLNDSLFILRTYKIKYNIYEKAAESKKVVNEKVFEVY